MSLFNNIMNATKQALKDNAPKIDLSIHGPTIPQKATIGINIPTPQINPENIDLHLNVPSINITSNMKYNIPEYAHSHPLIMDEPLIGECKLCK